MDKLTINLPYLQGDEKYIRALLNSSDSQYYLVDKTYKILAFNKIGLEIAEALFNHRIKINDNFFEFGHEIRNGFIRKKFQEAFLKKEHVTFEDKLFIHNQGSYWFDVHIVPIFDDNGSVDVVAFHSKNVTEKKLAEIALKEQEERYHSVVEYANDAIFVTDVETGSIIEVNEKAGKMLGYTKEEILQKKHHELRPLEKREQASAIFQEIKENKVHIFESVFQRKDGSTFPVEVSANQIMIKEKAYIQGFVRDISERREGEQILQESEKRFRTIIENTTLVISQCDTSLRYVWIYNAHPEYLHMPVVGKRDDEIMVNEGSLALQALKRQVINTGKGARMEITFPFRSGAITYDVMVEPILNHHKIITGISIIQSDITQQRKAFDELDSFVYRVSHDLRAPISSALGIVELLRFNNTPEEDAQYLNMLTDTLHRQDKFIKDILDHSRNNRVAIKTDKINLKELITTIFKQNEHLGKDKNIDILIEIPNNILFYSDIGRLTIILNNLIANALKYTNPSTEKPYIRAMIYKRSKGIQLLIEDNGLGIESQHIDKIFDMFYRATDTQHGSGLGLYIVKESVQKLKGRITVQSKTNKGTTFDLYLPSLQLIDIN